MKVIVVCSRRPKGERYEGNSGVVYLRGEGGLVTAVVT